MKKSIIILNFLILFIAFASCKSNKQVSQGNQLENNQKTLESTIKHFFNENDSVIIIPNPKNEDLILYLSETKEKPANPVKNIRFFVYDKDKNSVIYKNNYSNAEIEWHNGNELILKRVFGIIDKSDGHNIKYYLIDVLTDELKEYNKSTLK
ncbi:MAG: hypothetical protein R6V23_15415 [Bacteroidales bacterium]